MARPLIGTTLGRYRLDALLGEGGMAQVYRATDPDDGGTVAVKVIHPRLAGDPAFVARFLREARTVARLQHPCIVPLRDFGEDDGLPYIVMPYLGGGTFADRLRAGLTPDEALALLGPIAAALDYAHVRGVVHRDVKPSNILFTDEGEPLLADFGIAREVGEAAITAVGSQIGTVRYLAPEQAQGQPLDGRADLYALAVIFFEALTGQPPFPMSATDTILSVAVRVIAAQPPPPRSINPDLPAGVDAVLLRALAKSPAERYAAGGDLCAALSAALSPAPAPPRPVAAAKTQTPPRPPGNPPAARRDNGSARLAAIAGVALAFLLVCVVSGLGLRLLSSRDQAADGPESTATAPPGVAAQVETPIVAAVIVPTATTPPPPTFAPTATATPTRTATLAPPTATPTPPTATAPLPTERPAQPTPTPVPPTATVPPPPAPTAIPPTATRVPPTATPVPPTATVAPTSPPAPPPTAVPTAVAASPLETTARRAILSLPGTSSGVFVRLNDPVTYAADDPDMVLPAGSLIKLPIAAAAYEQVALGHWQPNETFKLTEANRTGGTGIIRDRPLGTTFTLDQLIETMLLHSDNTAANMLIDRLGGFGPVNDYAARLGMGHTTLRRKLFDQAAQARGLENTTTTNDIAHFLLKLGAGQVVNAAVSERLMGNLVERAQQDREWMLRDLPGGVNAAHLTGTLTGLRADAGIIADGGNLYILVLIARDPDEAGIERSIARVSAEIYQAVARR
ncbi:MAG: serine hydrolase [Thermomicrobiales bacterium]